MSKNLIYLLSVFLVLILVGTDITLGAPTPKTAHNPIPADGATSVNMNVTLSWTPGLGAKLYIVYFGDNFDDVYYSAGGLPQATPAFTPGLLESDKTYYWRVDEFDAVGTRTGDIWSFTTRGQILAFPGAEGAGRYSSGGRGGDVYHVTNVNDSGAGSLRYGLNLAAGPRIIVFDVSGNIQLKSDLSIGSDITIAGQTAPGDGITICNRQTTLRGDNVIVRYIRFRPGDVYCPGYQPDALSIRSVSNVIVDHVSASWGIDEILSATHGSTNVTVQWSMVTEALHNSCHSKGNHGYGSLINGGDFTFHHNLYAHNRSRNPRPGAGEGTRLDWVNNVVYNPGSRFGYGDGTPENSLYINYVNNYGIGGPNTSATAMHRSTEPYTHIYQSGNLMDLNKNNILDGTDKGWDMFSGPETHHSTRFDLPEVTTHSAIEAYNLVLAETGASLVRDAVDNRVIETVRNQTGTHIDSQWEVGGWPELSSGSAPLDTDQDGMHNDWELTQGLDPYELSDANGDHDDDGYTNIEEYINWIPTRVKETPPPTLNTNTLSYALDTTLIFTTGGSADWFNQTTTYYQDHDAAQSGDITHDQESWLQTTVNGAGTVSFYWKVSSEGNCDYLEFCIDGGRQDRISDSEDWHNMTYQITGSTLHTLEWRYVKDESIDRRDDCGWVDYVEWVPAP